jgi:hypothetical protein
MSRWDQWDWLQKTVVVCWVISIGPKAILMIFLGREVIYSDFFQILDLVTLAAAVLTILLLIRWGVRWFRKGDSG